MKKEPEKTPQISKKQVAREVWGVAQWLFSMGIMIFILYKWITVSDVEYVSDKALQMRKYAVEEMISFDNSANIIEKNVEIVRNDVGDGINTYNQLKITISANIRQDRVAKLVLETDFFGEKQTKKIFVDNTLVEDYKYPERNIIINIYERFKFRLIYKLP